MGMVGISGGTRNAFEDHQAMVVPVCWWQNQKAEAAMTHGINLLTLIVAYVILIVVVVLASAPQLQELFSRMQ